MTPARVGDLLLGRSQQTLMTDKAMILWVDPVSEVTERALQDELVRLLDEQALKLGDRRLHVCLGDPGDPARALEALDPAGSLRV